MIKTHCVVLLPSEMRSLVEKLEEIGGGDQQSGFSKVEGKKAADFLTRPNFRSKLSLKGDEEQHLWTIAEKFSKLEKRVPFCLARQSLTAASLTKIVEALKKNWCFEHEDSDGPVALKITETGKEVVVEDPRAPCTGPYK